MKPHHLPSHLAAAVLVLSALCLCVPSTGAESPLGLPPPVVPQGVGIAVHFSDPGGDPQAPEMTQFAAAGFGFARMDMPWGDVEKTRGVYDFAKYDALTDKLAAAHCRPLYIIDYYNPLYDGGLAPHTDAGRAAFARFAAAAAAHFRGRGVVWEIWNEPNGLYWAPLPNVEDYSRLAVVVARAIRAADPHAAIIAPATADIPADFLRTVFRHGLLRYIDGVSIHPYRGKNPETVDPEYLALHTLIASCTAPGRPPVPIVCSEWGYPSYANWGNVMNQAPPITEATQGRYIVREWLSNLAVGVNLTVWYDWRENGTDPNNPEFFFGTVHQKGAPKPAYTTSRTLIQRLYGYRYAHRLAAKSPSDWRLLFVKGRQLAVVYWSTDLGTPGEAQTPQIRTVAPTDPDYAALLRAADVEYGSVPLVATPATPAELPVTVTNPSASPMNAVVAVAGLSRSLHLAPHQQQTTTFLLPGDIMSTADVTESVTVTMNGVSVAGLPPVSLSTVGNIDLNVLPTASGRQIHIDALDAPFHGTVQIVTNGKAMAVPVNLAAFASMTLSQSVDPAKEVSMTAINAQGRIIGRMPSKHFVALAFPTTLQGDSLYRIEATVGGVTRTDPAPVVPAGAAAPASVALALPDQPAGRWNLRPASALKIPAGARELVVWVRADNSLSNFRTQYRDSTGQVFQDTLDWMNWTGWKPVHIPLNGIPPPVAYNGAADDVRHYPLFWEVVVMADAFRAMPQPTILIAAPYYEMP